MKHLYIIILIIISTSGNIKACSCFYGGPFLEVAGKKHFIAFVRVIKFLSFNNTYESTSPLSMEVEIIEILKGKEERNKITVWGDPGHLCRPYLSNFKQGNFYLIAFDSANPSYQNSEEKLTDYSISVCGAYWLSVNKKTKNATGDINSKDKTVSSLSLKKIKSELKKVLINE